MGGRKGVLNFADDYSKIPPAYRNKVEEVNIAKMGPSIASQTSPGKMAVSPTVNGERQLKLLRFHNRLYQEGDFALKLATALKLGTPTTEVQAEDMLTAVGIAPKNGWIADYPMTPIIIGQVRNAVVAAAALKQVTDGKR